MFRSVKKIHLERRDYLMLNEWEHMKNLREIITSEYNWEKEIMEIMNNLILEIFLLTKNI